MPVSYTHLASLECRLKLVIESINTYFGGYKYAGVAEAGSALYYNKNGETTSAPTDEDKQDLGSGIPKFTYGITLNAEYKGCLLYTSLPHHGQALCKHDARPAGNHSRQQLSACR